MKVKKIHIENYRMLKRIDIDLEENLSLIIGKNNCGKTSFLSIKSLLIDGISDEQGNRLINLQTIITSHSSHIVSECDFDDIKYFKIIK